MLESNFTTYCFNLNLSTDAPYARKVFTWNQLKSSTRNAILTQSHLCVKNVVVLSAMRKNVWSMNGHMRFQERSKFLVHFAWSVSKQDGIWKSIYYDTKRSWMLSKPVVYRIFSDFVIKGREYDVVLQALEINKSRRYKKSFISSFCNDGFEEI